MEFVKFNEFKKQMQKLYNFKAKEEREILYSCILKKDPLNQKESYIEQLRIKKRLSNILLTQQSLSSASIEKQNDSNVIGTQLVALTKSRNNFFLEVLYINSDNIVFPYSSNLNLLINLNAKIDEAPNIALDSDIISTNTQLSKTNTINSSHDRSNTTENQYIRKTQDSELNYTNNLSNNAKKAIGRDKLILEEFSSNNTVNLKFSDKILELEFMESTFLREFLWCIVKVIDNFVTSANIQAKGFNYKDLEEFAEKKKFYSFNKIFEIEKKKEKYEIDVTDEELETLRHTLSSLDIANIIEFDLENLNTKIEQFNIKTKEDFLQSLQGSFGKGVIQIREGHANLESKLREINDNLIIDSEMIEQVWNSIQKIEEANHRVELRWENKRKLEEYMKNLLNQLVINPNKEQSLLRCRYISNSDIIIVSEILDKFLKFFKSRKKQDVKLAILSEGRQKIKGLVDSMIMNYFESLADFIRGNFFQETFLLSELPMFNSNKINLIVSKNIEKNRQRRISLNDYLNDRKFFIQKINSLFNKTEMAVDDILFNEKKYFEKAINLLSKSLSDLLNNEVNIWRDSWNGILVSDMNVEMMDINLSSDSLQNYDALEYFNKDIIYESIKFMGTVVLNSFLAIDNCCDSLLNFFGEKPNFFLDKNSQYYQNAENEISKLLLETISNFFDDYIERCNILLPLIYYDILNAIHERISKNLMEDVFYICLEDIIEIKNYSEEIPVSKDNYNSNNNNLNYLQSEANSNRKFNFGFEEHIIGNKISVQSTKSFIKSNLKTMSIYLLKYFNNQKTIIENFICKPRRIGIIPVIKKGCNLLKLIILLTCQIKQDYIYQQTEEFIAKMKMCIEKISKIEPKYTTIILLENYFYLNKFLKSFEQLNITNARISEMEKYCFAIYEKYKDAYIDEVFSYQFKEFSEFYNKLNYEFEQQGDKIKTQSAFIFANFSKKTTSFLKEIPKSIERFADRVHKHFCKEENLSPLLFIELQNFLRNIVLKLENFFSDCYKSQPPTDFIKNAIDSIMKFDFSKVK